jgi:hypothetical protein
MMVWRCYPPSDREGRRRELIYGKEILVKKNFDNQFFYVHDEQFGDPYRQAGRQVRGRGGGEEGGYRLQWT